MKWDYFGDYLVFTEKKSPVCIEVSSEIVDLLTINKLKYDKLLINYKEQISMTLLNSMRNFKQIEILMKAKINELFHLLKRQILKIDENIFPFDFSKDFRNEDSFTEDLNRFEGNSKLQLDDKNLNEMCKKQNERGSLYNINLISANTIKSDYLKTSKSLQARKSFLFFNINHKLSLNDEEINNILSSEKEDEVLLSKRSLSNLSVRRECKSLRTFSDRSNFSFLAP